MTFIANAAHLAADASGAMSAGKLRGALRRLFASDWTERWMIVVNDHAVGTLSRDATSVKVAWFDHADDGAPDIAPDPDAPLAALHQEIARKLDVEPHRVVFLPIGE
ncbi:MAG: hypothetical protein NVSMB26_23760 [Beijerinckiaceae bacterium]